MNETPARNLRLDALIEANRFHPNTASPAEVVKTAAIFFDFLDGRTITPGEHATMNFEKRAAEVFNREYYLECALAEIAKATDSRGRKIVLMGGVTAGPDLAMRLRVAISKQVHSWGPDSQFIGSFDQSGIEAERNFWHNVGLLVKALELAV